LWWPREIPQQFESEAMAFLGVKLDAHDIPPMDGASEIVTVSAPGADVVAAFADDMVRVNKVEARVRNGGSGKEGITLPRADKIPAHVWDLQTWQPKWKRKALRFCCNPAQSWSITFLASPGEQLQSEADSEHGHSLHQGLLAEGINKA
jgi:hypothetical protein